MIQRCSRTTIAAVHDSGPATTGLPCRCIALCAAVLLAWSVAGCSTLPQCQKCVMPADEHSYGPLTPFGHYETHWNVWPTELGEEYEAQSQEEVSPKTATPSTDTLSPPDSEIPPSPGGDTGTDPLDFLLPPPETTPKPAPLPDMSPGGPMTPAAQPDIPFGLPPAGAPSDSPPGDSDLPKTTLPPLPNPDELKPAGELLPESLLPKDEAPTSLKTDEEKKSKPLEPPKQSRAPRNDPRRSRLSSSGDRATPELSFPERRVQKASADVPPSSRPSKSASGWRGKSTGETMQPDESGGKWQGRRATTPSINRQASHFQEVNRPTPTSRSASVEPAVSTSATDNPLR